MKIKCLVFVRNFERAKKEFVMRYSPDVIIGEYPFISALGVQLSACELERIANYVWVEYISSQVAVSTLLNVTRNVLGIDDLHSANILGQGTTVAVIDTGISPHLDFLLGKSRLLAFVDLINNRSEPYDDNGHGTFVAGVLGGNGRVSNGKFSGVAPLCRIVVIKALDEKGQTETFKILEAMQWVYRNKRRFNINVVCMSFGSVPLPRNDPLIKGAETLWDAGITVVCASGNDGPRSETIKSPGASPKVITVGSVGMSEGGNDFYVSEFSSRGPAFNVIKPDIVAPGVDIVSTSNDKDFYAKMSGTSVATPFVAGISALIKQTHLHYEPNQIKGVLLYSAIKLSCDANDCGVGLLNPTSVLD